MNTETQTMTATDPYPWLHRPAYRQTEVVEVRFATQAQAIAYGATAAVFAPRDV